MLLVPLQAALQVAARSIHSTATGSMLLASLSLATHTSFQPPTSCWLTLHSPLRKLKREASAQLILMNHHINTFVPPLRMTSRWIPSEQ